MFPSFQQNSSDLSPWILAPASENTVWVVTAQFYASSTAAQIVNFTDGVPKRVATLRNAVPSDIVYDNITTDNTRRIWILENDSLAYYNPIAKNITVADSFSGKSPQYMTIDRQDRFWITLAASDQIVEYQPSGQASYYNVTNSCAFSADGCGLQGITVDPRDGSLWFAELAAGRIGHLTPCYLSPCPITDFSPPSPLDIRGIIQVAVDRSGTVWFTDHNGNEFGSFDPSTGSWELLPIGYCSDSYVQDCAAGLPNAISVDSRGIVWFSEHFAGRIGRYDPFDHILTEYVMPTRGKFCDKCIPYTWWMSPGLDNLVWFVSYGLGQIGYVNASIPVPLLVTSPGSLSIAQGRSSSIPISATFTGQAPSLNASGTTLDTSSNPPMLSWSVSPEQVSTSEQTVTSTLTVSTAWSSTLGSHYMAVSASNQNVTVNAFVRVSVVTSLSAYATIGLVGGVSAFSAITVSLDWNARRRRMRNQS
jgi:streptogramin lyase